MSMQIQGTSPQIPGVQPDSLESLVELGRYDRVSEMAKENPKIFFDLCKLPPSNKILKCLEFILERGFDVNLTDKTGVTALHIACTNENNPLAELLLRHGADRKLVHDKKTPLHIAKERNCAELVKLLSKEDLILINGLNVLQFLKLTKTALKAADEAASTPNAALLTGRTGSGKTTFINWHHGCCYKLTDEGLVPIDKESIHVNHGQSYSDTIILQTYGDIIDSPGQFDTRGEEYDLSHSIALCQLLKLGAVKKLIIILPGSYFTDDRNYELRNFCNPFGEMVKDYEKIKESVQFVITQLDRTNLHGTSVDNFLRKIAFKIKKIPTDSKQDHHILMFLNMINRENIFLADYSDSLDMVSEEATYEQLREKSSRLRDRFKQKLIDMPTIEEGALRHNLTNERLARIQSVVNVFFRRIISLFRKEDQTKTIAQILDTRVTAKKEEIESELRKKEEIQQRKFDRPSITMPRDVIAYYEREISNAQKNIENCKKKMEDCAKKILDTHKNLRTLADGSQKSLDTLLTDLQELNIKLIDLNQDTEWVFLHQTIDEIRMRILGIFSFTACTFYYNDKERPYVRSAYSNTTGQFKDLQEQPNNGFFQAGYETGFGEDGHAEMKIFGQKKIYYKNEIKTLQDKITALQSITQELENLIEQWRKQIDEYKMDIGKENEKIKDYKSQMEVIEKKRQVDVQETLRIMEQNFDKRKEEDLQSTKKKIDEQNRDLKFFLEKHHAIVQELKLAEEELKRIRAQYKQEDSQVMLKVAELSELTGLIEELELLHGLDRLGGGERLPIPPEGKPISLERDVAALRAKLEAKLAEMDQQIAIELHRLKGSDKEVAIPEEPKSAAPNIETDQEKIARLLKEIEEKEALIKQLALRIGQDDSEKKELKLYES